MVLAIAGYLAVAVVVWWHMWALGLGHSIAANGWGDPDQDVWYLAWVPHALGNGLNPFISRAMFAPNGINLVVNTSVLLPAFVLSPVTVIFGPIVSFNVAVVLAPVANATALFLVLRRWAPFAGGRWLAGLFYGFMSGHLHMTVLVFPPIALGLLDDLLIRQRGNPVFKGSLLGLALAAQFLTGQEVLAMILMLTAVGVILLAIRFRALARQRWRRAAAGLVTAAAVMGVLLAYPLYLLLAGPRRFAGTVFKIPYGYVIWLKALLWPIGGSPPHTWPSYVGIPLLVLVALGCWKIRGALRFAAVMALVALVFAMGGTIHWTPTSDSHIPLPDKIYSHWPLLKNLLPVRFAVMIDMFVAMVLAIVLDRSRYWLFKASAPPGPPADGSPGAPETVAPIEPVLPTTSRRYRGPLPVVPPPRRAAAAYAGAAVMCLGVVALVSPGIGAPIPFPSRAISIPAVFRSPALTHLPSGTVMLGFPIPDGFYTDPLVWQAAEAMPYNLVAGYGFIPGPGPAPIGSLTRGAAVTAYEDAQVGLLPSVPDPATVVAVRSELRSWGVSVVVEYKGYRQLDQPEQLAELIDAVTGRQPAIVDGAFVWHLPAMLP